MSRPDRPDPPSLGELTIALERAFDLIRTLREQLDTVITELTPPRRRQQPIQWTTLDAEAAAATWQQLGAWVSWLVDRYAMREVPVGCWWRHGMLIEELTALWQAWQTSYAPDADGTAPLLWHEHLDRARDRIRLRLQQQGNCISAGHHDPTPPTYPGAAEQFRAHITADVEARLAAPPPADRDRSGPPGPGNRSGHAER
jgi:hypothetical protein